MSEHFPITITRQEPALWIERIVLFGKDNPWTILQDFKFTRGVNVIWGASTDSAKDAARGHSVGKTTLIRLIRYALGEENFGTKADQEQIRYEFRRGHIGLTLHIGGTRWSIMRYFGVSGAEKAGANRSIEELVTADVADESYSAFRHEINRCFVKAWPFPSPPDSDRDYEWAHMLGWMARDQEARHRGFHLWRDKNSEASMKAFLHEKKDPLHFVRMLLGCVSPEEFQQEKQVSDLEDRIKAEETRQQKAAVETDARRLNLESLISAFIPQEQRKDAIEFSVLKSLGTQILEHARDLARDASEMAENALRTCREKKRGLEDQITQGIVTLDMDDSKRKFPEELRVEYCPLAQSRLSECKPFQDRVARIKEEMAALVASGKIMDNGQRAEFIAKKLAINDELQHLKEDEKRLLSQVTGLSRKFIKAEAAFANYVELWKEWEELSFVSAREKPESEETLERLRLDGKRFKAHLKRKQLDNKTYPRLSRLYSELCRYVLGSAYSGEIEYPPREDNLSFSIHAFHRKNNGAAVTTLGNHLADITALLWSAAGEGCHPGFLIHDSPREADMTERIYDDYLLGVNRLADELGGENAPFQYIFSTTTKPPQQLSSLIRVNLAGYPENKLLFKKRLGKEDELQLIVNVRNPL